MPKLIIIAVALVFAFLGYRKTFYPSWAFLFNILVSVYTSIMITPQIVDKVPFIRVYLGSFSYSAFILISAVIIFVVMHFLSFKFFTAVYIVTFPKIFNSAGAAVLGFLTGLAISGFLLFLVTITPLSDFPAVKFLAQNSQTADGTNTVVLTTCNFVHGISLQPSPTAIDKQMEKILTGWQKPVVKADSSSPADDTFPIKPRLDE
jgi:hypothetical protein